MGRHGIIENHSSIDVNELNRLGAFGRATIAYPYVGLRLPSLSIMRTNYSAIEVQFAKDKRWQSITIRWTRCHFGGQRPWLECPCGRRTGKLYDSGFCFGCRQCLNLIYESQRRGANVRRYLRLLKLRARCGGSSSITEPFPSRPARMCEKTYLQLRSRAALLEMELRRSRRFMKKARNYALRATAKAIHRPSSHHIKLAACHRFHERVEAWALLAALGP